MATQYEPYYIDADYTKLLNDVQRERGHDLGEYLEICVSLTCDDPAYQEARAALLPFARTSHRAEDLRLLVDEEDRHG